MIKTIVLMENKERKRDGDDHHLLVLIGRDGDELSLLEDERLELAPWQLDYVVLLDDVEAWLILVHRVEYCLHTHTNRIATNRNK